MNSSQPNPTRHDHKVCTEKLVSEQTRIMGFRKQPQPWSLHGSKLQGNPRRTIADDVQPASVTTGYQFVCCVHDKIDSLDRIQATDAKQSQR
jgi:hypothetical protein